MTMHALHAVHCSVAQRSRLILLSVFPNSDESGKQSLYLDGDPDLHQNLIVCSLAHCQSLRTNRQTDRQTATKT